MNGEARKEDASVRIVGRGFIIIVVVVFSSLSFTLGYFVGKNNAERRPDPVVQTAPQPADVEPRQSVPAVQPLPANVGKAEVGGGTVQDAKSLQNTVSLPSEDRRLEGKLALGPKETANDIPAGDLKKSESKEPPQTESKPHIKPAGGEDVYTVQFGALKNAAEARHLKNKYSKKGYKIYITVTKNKGNVKIYKVRTGEFKEKKDAEILALKLKKSEGLSAFVTVKKD